jgi:hypothetical protein
VRTSTLQSAKTAKRLRVRLGNPDLILQPLRLRKPRTDPSTGLALDHNTKRHRSCVRWCPFVSHFVSHLDNPRQRDRQVSLPQASCGSETGLRSRRQCFYRRRTEQVTFREQMGRLSQDKECRSVPLGYPSGSVSMSAHTMPSSHVMPQASHRAVALSQCSSCYRHNACSATTY